MPKKADVNSDCIACDTCESLCPSVFKVDHDAGISLVLEADYEANKDAIDESIDACPVDAISWVEAEE